jgi:pimeloyl-ACP methyl ester carboxylesterase
MTEANGVGALDVGGQQLEFRHLGPGPDAAPTLVLLHEGLGCVGLWGDFPDRLAAATGFGVLAYSRAGYGASSVIPQPRPLDYMQREALEVLPRVLAAVGFQRGLLVGHSDGASIAAIYAGGVLDHRVRGVSLMAPHFVVEDVSIAAIEAAKQAYEVGDLRAKLARWHRHVEVAFRGWNDAWLDPGFRGFDIIEPLAYIRVPVQIIQGDADPFGTRRQIEIAESECGCPVDAVLLSGVGHAPHREAPERTLELIAGFANRILRDHEGFGRK